MFVSERLTGTLLDRILTDRGTEATQTQTNGICEWSHKTLKHECYSLLFRNNLYRSLEDSQAGLDAWLDSYNRERPHSNRYCYGKTLWETF